MNIRDLELSVRSSNALIAADIQEVQQIVENISILNTVPYLGDKSKIEILSRIIQVTTPDFFVEKIIIEKRKYEELLLIKKFFEDVYYLFDELNKNIKNF